MADDYSEIQARFPVAKIEVRGEVIDFPIEDDSLSGGNRIVEHTRPYRDGSKLDDTGSQPRRWTLNAIFNNTIQESGLSEFPPLYPDRMNRIIELFTYHETVDLTVPVDGKVRARAASYERSHSRDETDTGRLRLTFTEDNEDNVDATSFSRPSVNGALVRLLEITRFTAEQEGVWNKDLVSLGELCSQIETMVRMPGEYASAVASQVRGAQRAIRNILRTVREEHAANLSRLRDLSNAPEAASEFALNTTIELMRLLDVTSFAINEKTHQLPRRIPYVVRATTTIFAIAADVRQPVDALLEINEQRIDDPLLVEPGTYRVFERWP
ncbi:MAG: DNA circularization N-terminal domain-containing protein [Myxococcota bacterium]